MLDLKSIIDNLPLAIFVVDDSRRILLSNRLAKKCHGLDQNESNTRRFGDIVGCTNAYHHVAGCGFSEFCQYCQVKAMIDRAFAAKSSSAQFETDISTRSMGVRSLSITVSHIGSNAMPASEKGVCVVTVEDLTERKKKEKLAAAVETIGAVCHELNQPLQAIMGSVALLAMFQLEDGAMARIEKINGEIQRIRSINHKLMNITHYQTKPYLSTTILDIEKSATDSANG